jgi:hypothetical protein
MTAGEEAQGEKVGRFIVRVLGGSALILSVTHGATGQQPDTTVARQPRSADANVSSRIRFPPNRPYRSGRRVRQEYDKFADTTTAMATITYSPGFIQSLFKASMVIHLKASFEGRIPRVPPATVTATFTLSNLETADELAKDTVPRGKIGPRPTGPTRATFVTDDGARISIDLAPLGRKITPFGDNVFTVQDGFQAELSLSALLQLANAARQVDGRFRNADFKIAKDELEALKDFASRLAPEGVGGLPLASTPVASAPEMPTSDPRNTPKTDAVPTSDTVRASSIDNRALLSQMRMELRLLVNAQEAFHLEHRRFSQDLSQLNYRSRDAEIEISLLEATRDGWAARSVHARLPGKSCVVFGGEVGQPPATFAEGKTPTADGAPVCDIP